MIHHRRPRRRRRGRPDLLARRVVEACIYGVDKNELAVELAKLSLWLVTVSGDKPLSFLDHHLRHGDSLIGAWLKDLDRPPTPARPDRFYRPVKSTTGSGTDPLFDDSAFTTSAGRPWAGWRRLSGCSPMTSTTCTRRRPSGRRSHDTHLARWRRLADLWISAWFGNEMSAAGVRRPGPAHPGPRRRVADRRPGRPLPRPPNRHRQRLLPLGAGVPGGVLRPLGRPMGAAGGLMRWWGIRRT